jgi:hypothetical protein
MQDFKDGDIVMAWDMDNGSVLFGHLSDVNIQDGEADLDYIDGSGSCSPIGLADAVIIPLEIAQFLQRATLSYEQTLRYLHKIGDIFDPSDLPQDIYEESH